MRRRGICILLTALLIFAGLPMSGAAAAELQSEPVIKLTTIPKYGDSSAFRGIIYTEDGSSFNAENYRISLYLQISQDGQYWVKPTYAKPYADINNDGSFSINYATGGSDQNAVTIHIMLITSNYTPTADFNATKANALDYVKVNRASDGTVTVDPDRTVPQEKEENGTIKINKVSSLKVSSKKLAVDVGFYITGAPGGKLSEKTIKKQLKVVKKYSNTVRFYGAAGQITKAYKMAHNMGLKVIGSAYLSKDKAANKKEINALIKVCKKGYVSVACVGNETLLNGYLTEDEVIGYMDEVKGKISMKIPVTTSDDAFSLISHSKVCENCDLLMVNIYPYWGGVSIGEAKDAFDSTFSEVRSAYPDKEIIVSETGWPTAGGRNGDAVASGTNARKYFNAIRKWSLGNKVVVLWFDAADEPWKKTNEGTVGAHWGLMTKKCRLKGCYKKTDLFKNIKI